MDMARWGLGVTLPHKVQSMGGHFTFDDDKETLNSQITVFEYPEAGKLLQFEVRHWITNHEGNFYSGDQTEVGVLFFGSEGYMTVKYFEYKTFLGKKREPSPSGSERGNEFASFTSGVCSRKREDLGVDIEDGHFSSALCHLANISYRLGRTIEFDRSSETFQTDSEANKLLTRDYRPPFVVPAIT